jgi:hypothetical protein
LIEPPPRVPYVAETLTAEQHFCQYPSQSIRIVRLAVLLPPLRYGIDLKQLRFQQVEHLRMLSDHCASEAAEGAGQGKDEKGIGNARPGASYHTVLPTSRSL